MSLIILSAFRLQPGSRQQLLLLRRRAALQRGAAALAIALTLVGLGLRLYGLDTRSMWLDELVTASSARFNDMGELLGYVRFWIDNTPLIFVQTWLLRGFGGGDLVVRLPFAIAGTLNILAIYCLGKTLARPRVGLLAALLMTLLPFAVWYSQEARHYAPFMLLTTLQVLYAYKAVTEGRLRDWLLFISVSILNLYTTYLALPVMAALALYIGLALAFRLARAVRSKSPVGGRPNLRVAAGETATAAGAGLLIGLAYLPWLPALGAFLGRKDVGFGGISTTRSPTLDDLGSLLVGLDLTPLVLVLVAGGLLLCVVWLFRGRVRETGLIFIWVLIPLAVFIGNARAGVVLIPPRYFSFFYPAAVLLTALGVEAFALLLGRMHAANSRGDGPALYRAQFGPGLAYAALLLLLLSQSLPVLAASYARPKDDYEGAAALIKATSPPETLVIAMGMKSLLFFNDSFDYYFWLWHSPIIVEDGRALDYAAAVRLAHGNSDVWGAVYGSLSPDQEVRAGAAGFEVTPRIGFTLLKPARGTPERKGEDLLRWGSVEEPRLQTGIDLLQAVAGAVSAGDNTLDPPIRAAVPAAGVAMLGSGEPLDRWTLWPGSSVSQDGSAFHLVTNEQEVNTTWLTTQVVTGGSYEFLFRYRNSNLVGAQRVYISVHAADGRWLDTFPNGLGYLCAKSTDWTEEGFVFRVPAGTSELRVWLRVTGRGAADFGSVELRQLH